MLSKELIELANRVCKQKAEEQTIELKAAHEGCPKRLYDSLSSFSNQDSGGILLFGIDESRIIKLLVSMTRKTFKKQSQSSASRWRLLSPQNLPLLK